MRLTLTTMALATGLATSAHAQYLAYPSAEAAKIDPAGTASVAEPVETEVITIQEPSITNPAPASSWKGGYVVFQGGYGWLKDVDQRLPDPATGTPPLVAKGEDVVLGLRGGIIEPFGPVVIGIEGGYTRQKIQFELPAVYAFLGDIYAEDLIDVQARIGMAHGRFLATLNGGVGFATTNIGMEDWGLLLGATVDYKITDKVFVGMNYTHQFYREFDGVPLDADIDTVSVRAGLLF